MLPDHHFRVIALALQEGRQTEVIVGIARFHRGGPLPRKGAAEGRKQSPGGLDAVGEKVLEIDAVLLQGDPERGSPSPRRRSARDTGDPTLPETPAGCWPAWRAGRRRERPRWSAPEDTGDPQMHQAGPAIVAPSERRPHKAWPRHLPAVPSTRARPPRFATPQPQRGPDSAPACNRPCFRSARSESRRGRNDGTRRLRPPAQPGGNALA